MLQHLTFNVKGAKTRYATLEDRQYLVVPMVMLTEGVHAGSNGPLLYPGQELAKTPVVWNHKPVVVYHPTINGQGVSACDPDIVETRKIGLIMNTKYDGRLVAEAWLDVEKTKKVDERILVNIEKNLMTELSTGLFTDNEENEGEWQGEKYSAIARNYRPDHLAILPDKVGACSIADGAGLLRNEDPKTAPTKWGMPEELFRPYHLAGLRAVGLVDNAMSYSNINGALYRVIREKFGEDVWLEDVYDSFFIYAKDGTLYRLEYLKNDKEVEVRGTPEEVVRVTEYRTTEGAFVGNQTPHSTKEEEPAMTKAQLVDALIANKSTHWAEADRATLTGMDEKVLEKMAPVANADDGKEPVKTPVQKAAEEGAAPVNPQQGQPAPTGNTAAPAAPLTVDQYIANAPAGLQDVLRTGMLAHNTEKARLVGVITANKANRFTSEQLNEKSIGELQMLAEIAQSAQPQEQPKPSYAGAWVPPGPQPTGNQDTPITDNEPLRSPVWDYSSKAAS